MSVYGGIVCNKDVTIKDDMVEFVGPDNKHGKHSWNITLIFQSVPLATSPSKYSFELVKII